MSIEPIKLIIKNLEIELLPDHPAEETEDLCCRINAVIDKWKTLKPGLEKCESAVKISKVIDMVKENKTIYSIFERTSSKSLDEHIEAFYNHADNTFPAIMRVDEKKVLRTYQGNNDLPSDYYQTQSVQIVNQTEKKIQDAQKAHRNMKDVFYQLIDDLGRERFKIARKQETPEGLRTFGEFRHQPTERKSEEELSLLSTPLTGRYSEYGEKLQFQLERYLETVEIPITTMQVLRTETVDGYTVNLETCPNERGIIAFQQTITKDSKTYVLSRYACVRGEWSIQHQESSEMVRMMDGMVAEAFEKCIHTNSYDVNQLKKNVAVFRWLFSHATPYARGSAAIGEWFEKAIYEHHGYRNEYQLPFDCYKEGRPTVDLDALTSLGLSSFIKDYNQRIQLFPTRL